MAQDAALLQRPTEVVLLGTAGVGAVEIMRRTVTSKTCVWRRQ